MKVYKQNIAREINPSRLKEYLTAGWTSTPDVKAEEVIKLKPPVKSKGTGKEPLDNAINTGEE